MYSYDSYIDCEYDWSYPESENELWDGVWYKSGFMDGILVSAGWSVELDQEVRESRFCQGDFYDESDDVYRYCTSEAGDCGLDITYVSANFQYRSHLNKFRNNCYNFR